MTEQPKIAVRNLYQIFGFTPQLMVDKVRAGIGKAELLGPVSV